MCVTGKGSRAEATRPLQPRGTEVGKGHQGAGTDREGADSGSQEDTAGRRHGLRGRSHQKPGGRRQAPRPPNPATARGQAGSSENWDQPKLGFGG